MPRVYVAYSRSHTSKGRAQMAYLCASTLQSTPLMGGGVDGSRLYQTQRTLKIAEVGFQRKERSSWMRSVWKAFLESVRNELGQSVGKRS